MFVSPFGEQAQVSALDIYFLIWLLFILDFCLIYKFNIIPLEELLIISDPLTCWSYPIHKGGVKTKERKNFFFLKNMNFLVLSYQLSLFYIFIGWSYSLFLEFTPYHLDCFLFPPPIRCLFFQKKKKKKICTKLEVH